MPDLFTQNWMKSDEKMVVPNHSDTKEKLLKLGSEKDKLEARISEYGAVLATNGNVGMNGPLVDVEGFPRNDIDVYQVRQARQQIICLQNDYKELMKQIEQLMHRMHAEAASGQEGNQHNHVAALNGIEMNGSADSNTVTVNNVHPIVKVNLVSPGSPAEESGLRLDDRIVEFGTINYQNFANNLSHIGGVVTHMENQRINLKVLRGTELLDLILIPKRWSGRGLLGCNIVLLDDVER